MVETSVLQAIIIGIGTIAVGLITAGLWIWRHVESLNSKEDVRRVEELQDGRRSQLSDEVKQLYINIDEYLDENPWKQDSDIEFDDHVVTVVDNHINPSELNTLIEKAVTMDQPADTYNSIKDEYETCYAGLFWSGFFAIGLNAAIVIALINNAEPFAGTYAIVETLLAVGSVYMAYQARNHFNQARHFKNDFDGQWKEYRYNY